MISLKSYLEYFYYFPIKNSNIERSIKVGLIDVFFDEPFFLYKLYAKKFGDVSARSILGEHGFFSCSLLTASNDKFSGILPNSKLYFAGIADNEGKLSKTSILQALDWLEENSVNIVIMPIASRDHPADFCRIHKIPRSKPASLLILNKRRGFANLICLTSR